MVGSRRSLQFRKGAVAVIDSLIIFFADYGYIAVFGMLLLCGLGVPVPEDVTLVAGGVIGLQIHFRKIGYSSTGRKKTTSWAARYVALP